MTLQKRLQRVMRRRGWRVADLARYLGRPYMTVREWAMFGRVPADREGLDKLITRVEK